MSMYLKEKPRLILYEKPATLALGIADILFRDNGEKLRELLVVTSAMLNSCACTKDDDAIGCLDCVLLSYCLERNKLVNCKAARILLDLIFDG